MSPSKIISISCSVGSLESNSPRKRLPSKNMLRAEGSKPEWNRVSVILCLVQVENEKEEESLDIVDEEEGDEE